MIKGYIGLDLETSGTDHDTSAPIQLGLAYLDDRGDPHTFSSYIGGWNWIKEENLYKGHRAYNDYVWSTESEQIHRIPRSNLVVETRRSTVDHKAVEWLYNLPDLGDYKLIPLGWNVRGFDMPFVKQHLPRLYKRFQRRQVDLNGLVFTIDKMGLYKPEGGRWKFSTIKRIAKERAARRTELEVTGTIGYHDAEFDALASLYAWDELQKIIKAATLTEGSDTETFQRFPFS